MIEHVWSVLCEQALQNPKNGSMSYINTLDNLPVRQANKETGELALEPFLIATKWKKNTDEKVKLVIKVGIIGELIEKKDFFGPQEVDLGEGTAMAALNIDIDKMIVKGESKYHAFEVMYKYGKQRNYRSVAVLPFRVQKLIEKKGDVESQK